MYSETRTDSGTDMANKSTDLENWDDYMNAKKCKLQEQFKSEASKVDIKKDIFQGTSIFVNGYTVPTADELRLLMMEYGGTYHHYYSTGKTSYIIASNLPNVKINQFKTSNIRIVKPDWVVDSIKAGKMLDHKPYLLLSDLLPNTNTISFQNVPKSESSCQKSDSSSIEAGNIVSASTSRKTANDENFLEEFYNNSRLHHISTQGALFKQYINELRLKNITEFSGKENLRNWKTENHRASEYSLLESGSCIMHIDMDCFFVSVGLKKYPHLKSRPVVVTHAKGNKTKGDNVEARKAEFDLHEKRSREKFERDGEEYKPWFTDIGETDSMAEIASCSYEARKFGVKNGMLLGQAFKLCPHLKTIPYDFEGYKEVSYALYNHVASYTLDIEAVSCDEMYVDCTGILTYANVNVLDFATILRKEIKELTGCPCSTGFGPNRLLARLATKKAKPDGQFAVSLIESKEFIQHYDVTDLPGIGRSIATKLTGMGVKTCKDLQRIPVTRLQQEFGSKFGLTLHKHSLGEDSRPLNFCHQRKSVSAEVNYGIRFRNSLDAEKFLKKLSNEVENRLNSIGCRGKSITLKLMSKTEEAPTETAKYLGHGICNYVTKTVTLLEATSDTNVIYREVMKIVQNMQIKPPDFRGIGIQVSRLEYKKNTSTALKMDKFITRSKKPMNTDDGPCESIPEKSKPSICTTDTSAGNSTTLKTFDESEYDVSFSQIDQKYLAALPESIKGEIILKAKKRKKNIVDPNDYLPGQEDTSGCSFIIKENGLPKLNPMVPSTEVVEAMAEWISKETVPRDCDIKMLSDYIHELISNQEFESVNFIVDNFQRLISGSNELATWKIASQKLNKMIMKTMRSVC